MAIDETNAAGGIGGAFLELDEKDDAGAVPSGQDPVRGASNATALAADGRVVAIVGPASSKVASAMIPITNRAGLLQCSPTNTNPGLTKPRFGALDLRAAAPTRINYVRLAPADDIQGPASASFVMNDLGARNALVVDDSQNGREIADAFQAAFTARGGTVVRRALNPGADPAQVLSALSGVPGKAVVFFGGFTDTGAIPLRKAMVAKGLADVPLVSWDGLWDGSGSDKGSYIDQTGPAAVNSFISRPSIGPLRADFEQRYRTAFSAAPDEYSGAAYACVEVILDTLREVAKTAPSADALREAVRAYASDPAHRYETVLGTVGFDTNGDSIQQIVTLYRVEASAANGTGDWVVAKQQDFGPAS